MGAMSTQRRYEYVMDVSPGGRSELFSVTMITPLFCGRWLPLDVGDVVTVLCQAQTEKVKWDKREPSTSRYEARKAYEETRKQTADDEFDEALRRRPGTHRSG